MWADPDGVIFSIRLSGDLYCWRYLANDELASWANNGAGIYPMKGWGEDTQKTAFSNTEGTLYCVALSDNGPNGLDDQLGWYRMLNSDTVSKDLPPSWANNAF